MSEQGNVCAMRARSMQQPLRSVFHGIQMTVTHHNLYLINGKTVQRFISCLRERGGIHVRPVLQDQDVQYAEISDRIDHPPKTIPRLSCFCAGQQHAASCAWIRVNRKKQGISFFTPFGKNSEKVS